MARTLKTDPNEHGFKHRIHRAKRSCRKAHNKRRTLKIMLAERMTRLDRKESRRYEF